ncbi:uncharacterized protein LOC119743278 [Patiria miniata]|uniref:Integrase catalytic domain-containing protein n=1 Tax=Patiria miniata TaxID=46514 RepID=A0A914BH66_PATMI|nr:uncharacterized protein LOC119743278 [Patiria miniata]
MTPPIKHNDTESFEDFCLDVSSLVGMLESLDGQAEVELRCGSHVDKLLSKLSPSLRTSFIEHCIKKGILKPNSGETYTLPQFAAWLRLKSQSQMLAKQAVTGHIQDQSSSRVNRDHRPVKQKPTPTSAFLTGGKQEKSVSPKYTKPKPKPFCPFCDGKDHFLNGCQTFKALSTEEQVKWIQENKRCWKCCRKHEPDACTLKKPCHQCKEVHLTVLHEAAQKATSVFMVKPTSQSVYVDKPSRPCNTMLKVVRVTLHGPDSNIDSYAVLDDGSERTMLLQDAAQQLKLSGTPETMHLRTVREDLVICQGQSVSLSVSPHDKPDVKFSLDGVFAAGNLCLSEYTYPVKILQECYPHLRDLPLPLVDRARPVILIGSDHVDLIAPRRPIRFGPSGTPVAALTRLDWTLHGPASILSIVVHITLPHGLRDQCIDVVPYVNEKHVVRSKQDQRAVQLLEDKTARVVEGGIQRYVTPLLRTDNAKFHAPKEAVLPTLRRTERRLATRPSLAEKHNELIQKLVDAGYVRILAVEDAAKSEESWYIPHHTVEHNGKFRLVFNCSFQYQNQILNEHLLPGPSLGASLLGVLLRFRQHAVAVSGDIKAMFHQVRLQPTERCLFRFLWRNMKTDTEPKIYEWQVLPFGATCSPCCATYALRKHAFDHREKSAEVADAVDRSFYVDNCLVSVPQEDEAKALVHNMRDLLAKGGFEIRQWASNVPNVVADLPPEARSDGCDLWLTFGETDLAEPMLGLQWDCSTGDLQYRHRVVNYDCLNMRNMYKTLASQYDPNGYLTPFTARARVIVQDLWKTKRDWDDALEPGEIMDRWRAWEHELPNLSVIKLTRCYTPPDVNPETASRQLHIFCDASERIYGAVAYLRTEDEKHTIHTSFVMARSRVAPKKQLSMPRLELSAALAGAQLSSLLQQELTLPLEDIVLWSDSTTVLTWLKSESCRYKVFVGTRVAQIQTLTNVDQWRYVDTKNNAADDLTRGKSLLSLSQPCRWRDGPPFLSASPDLWPAFPYARALAEDSSELKKSSFCGIVTVELADIPDLENYKSMDELIEASKQLCDGAAKDDGPVELTADQRAEIELHLFQRAQKSSFPEEWGALKDGKELPRGRRLLQLSPEWDGDDQVIRVGGRLRHAEGIPLFTKHPIVLDPAHPVTKLLIQDFDQRLMHYGPERVHAEIRRRFWILRGRQAVRKHQRQCFDCQRWRATPSVPKMGDLPSARLRIQQPPFYSTGVDCFGPMTVKIGRRTEKRWGIIFKCMTTRAVHLDLLESLDTDAFLMAFRRFASRRGKPYELLSDCGTNFKGGASELKEAFSAMDPALQQELAKHQVRFRFNPPNAPHFGGLWEREIKSAKYGLRVVLNDQTVPEQVLRTVLIEVEGILNSKPLGYTSSDIADIDPVTPNVLLMGRYDPALPQVVYPAKDLVVRSGKEMWWVCARTTSS